MNHKIAVTTVLLPLLTIAAARNFIRSALPLRSSKNSLERIPQTIEQYKEKNAVLAKDIPLLKEIANKQWKKEDELKDLKSELAALDRKIQLELAKDKEPQQQQAVAKLDYRWFVTFDNYLRKKRTNNYKNRRKLKVFLLFI